MRNGEGGALASLLKAAALPKTWNTKDRPLWCPLGVKLEISPWGYKSRARSPSWSVPHHTAGRRNALLGCPCPQGAALHHPCKPLAPGAARSCLSCTFNKYASFSRCKAALLMQTSIPEAGLGSLMKLFQIQCLWCPIKNTQEAIAILLRCSAV